MSCWLELIKIIHFLKAEKDKRTLKHFKMARISASYSSRFTIDGKKAVRATLATERSARTQSESEKGSKGVVSVCTTSLLLSALCSLCAACCALLSGSLSLSVSLFAACCCALPASQLACSKIDVVGVVFFWLRFLVASCIVLASTSLTLALMLLLLLL